MLVRQHCCCLTLLLYGALAWHSVASSSRDRYNPFPLRGPPYYSGNGKLQTPTIFLNDATTRSALSRITELEAKLTSVEQQLQIKEQVRLRLAKQLNDSKQENKSLVEKLEERKRKRGEAQAEVNENGVQSSASKKAATEMEFAKRRVDNLRGHKMAGSEQQKQAEANRMLMECAQKLREKTAEMEERLMEFDQKLTVKKDELVAVKNRFEGCQSSLAKVQKRTTEKRKSEEDEAKKLAREIAGKRDQLDVLNQKLEETSKNMENLQARSQTQMRTLQDVEDQIQNKVKGLAEFEGQLAAKKADLTDLDNKKAHLEAELQEMAQRQNQQMAEGKKRLTAFEIQIQQREVNQQKLEAEQKTLEELQRKAEERLAEIEAGKKELDNLQTILQAKRRELDDLVAKLDEGSEKIKSLENHVKIKEIKQKALDANLKLEAKFKEANEEIGIRENKLADLGQRYKDLEAKVAAIETQFSELEAKKAELALQLKSLVAELEMKRNTELEAQLAEMERRISEARENKNTGPVAEFPALANSMEFGQRRGLSPCDDFYKFVCSGKDKSFKDRHLIKGGGVVEENYRKHQSEVMRLFGDTDFRNQMAQKHKFMAQSFIFYDKCLNKRWEARRVMEKIQKLGRGIDGLETSEMILNKLMQKHGQKIFGTASMGEVNFTKSWIDKAGPFLPFLGIEEISYVRRLPKVVLRFDGRNFHQEFDITMRQDLLETMPKQEIKRLMKETGRQKLFLQMSNDQSQWFAAENEGMHPILRAFSTGKEKAQNQSAQIKIEKAANGTMQLIPLSRESANLVNLLPSRMAVRLMMEKGLSKIFLRISPDQSRWLASDNELMEPILTTFQALGNVKGETNNGGRSGRGKRSVHLQKPVQEANNEPLDPEFEVVTGISFSFEPKLFPDRSLLGNAGSFSTLDAKKKTAELSGQKVAEMMTALYKQGMFGDVGDIQERMDGIKGLEKNLGKALANSKSVKKNIPLSELNARTAKLSIDWVKLIQSRFPQRNFDGSSQVEVDLAQLDSWQSWLLFWRDEKTLRMVFSDYLRWNFLLGEFGEFRNVDELYKNWWNPLAEEAKLLDSLWHRKNVPVDQPGQDKQFCFREELAAYFPHAVDRAILELLNAKTSVEKSMDKNRQMLKYVRQAFEQMLDSAENEWMDKTTRKYAIQKLHAMQEFVGFLPHTLDEQKLQEVYGGLDLHAGMHWLVMLDQMLRHKQARNKRDPLAGMDDGDMLEQNAAYRTGNQLMINAMNFLEPSFNITFPDAYNFGSIGWTMGHEITHGFDTTGKSFFLQGIPMKEPGWWTKGALEEYDRRKKCLKEEYANYEVPKYRKDGDKTINENIADNGGLRASYKGWEMFRAENPEKSAAQSIKGIFVPDQETGNLKAASQEQLFFIGAAFSQCRVNNCEKKKGEDNRKECNEGDVHSIDRVRVNVALRMFEKFHQAFECPVGSPMNPKPKDGCRVW